MQTRLDFDGDPGIDAGRRDSIRVSMIVGAPGPRRGFHLPRSHVGAVVLADGLEALSALPDESVPLVYIDPPFNTGRRREMRRLRVARDDRGARVGFGGRRYSEEEVSRFSYADSFDDYLSGFLAPRLEETRRVLAPEGSLFLHLDPRESHYVKVLLDKILGRSSFRNEIVWAYDYGGRPRDRWPSKHDVILWYSKDPRRWTFDRDAIDRVPYMAPGLVGPEKAARGKIPTDVWWQTVVPTMGRERTGYPTQKPLAILDRIVRVHSRPGDLVLDFFAGSGTTGEAALLRGRRCILADDNPEAIGVMRSRLVERCGVSFDSFAETTSTVEFALRELADSAASSS